MSSVDVLWAAAACLILIGIAVGLSSAIQSVSYKKGKQRLIALLCIGTAICAGSLAMLKRQTLLPTYEVSGQIERVQVRAQGRGSRTAVTVRVGHSQVVLDASGTSPYFIAGQSIRVRYQGVSGDILKVHFLSTNGTEVAVFNGTDTWSPYWSMLLGVFVIVVGNQEIQTRPRSSRGTLK